MGKKSMYTNYQPPHDNKTAEHAATLRRVADEMPSDYESHAKTIRSIADHLDKSHGQPRTKESHGNQSGPGHKKVNAALGG